MERKDYWQPKILIVELSGREGLLNVASRSDYGDGGEGFVKSDFGSRSDYDSGGDGFSESSLGGRSGYGDGGDGFY